MTNIFAALAAILLLICPATAQQEEKGTYGQLSLGYVNDFIWLGRKDSVANPYITPQAGWNHASGFFVNGSLSYLARSGSGRIDMGTLEAGFEKEWKGKITFGAFADAYFYNSKSTNIRAEMKGMLGVYGGYNFGPLSLGGHIWYGMAQNSDWMTGLQLYREFPANRNRLTIRPELALNAATQNFYKSYYQQTTRRLRNGQVVTVVPNVEEATRFKILDYEASLEMKYSLGAWEFSLKPTLFLPVNPSVITIRNLKFTETLSNAVTIEAGAAFTF